MASSDITRVLAEGIDRNFPTRLVHGKVRIEAGSAVLLRNSARCIRRAFHVGLDNNGTKFLFAASAAGVSFRRTAMLGRQNFFPTPRILQSLLNRRGAGKDAAQFIAESGSYAERFFEFLGADEVVAIDNSDYEGAKIVVDMNAPIASALKNRFTAIFDGGCLEHVFNFPQAIRNCMEMLSVGGHFIGITPANNFCGHGFYQFSPELYFRIFSEQNGFAIRVVLTKEKDRWFRVADPETFGARVELQNNRPTYLFVLAKKTAQRDIFSIPPQQSDYARRWQDGGATVSPFARIQPGRQFLRSILRPGLKERLRPIVASISIRHRYPCYETVAEEAVLRGEFESTTRTG